MPRGARSGYTRAAGLTFLGLLVLAIGWRSWGWATLVATPKAAPGLERSGERAQEASYGTQALERAKNRIAVGPTMTGAYAALEESLSTGAGVDTDRAPATIEGRVLDPSGQPLSGNRFRLSVLLEETQDGGRSWSPVGDGGFQIVSCRRDGGFLLDQQGHHQRYRVHLEGTQGQEPVYLLEPSHIPGDVQTVTLRTHAGATISGTVVGLQGIPTQVRVQAAGVTLRTGRVRPDTGAFLIDTLPSGEVTVEVVPHPGLHPVHSIEQVFLDPRFPQDARLTEIFVHLRPRTIELYALPPFAEQDLRVNYRSQPSGPFSLKAHLPQTGSARIYTLKPRVDVLISAPGSCVQLWQGLSESTNIQLERAIPVEIQLLGAAGIYAYRVRHMRMTSQSVLGGQVDLEHFLWRDEQDPSLWRGMLTAPGTWNIQWKLANREEIEARKIRVQESSWDGSSRPAPPGHRSDGHYVAFANQAATLASCP